MPLEMPDQENHSWICGAIQVGLWMVFLNSILASVMAAEIAPPALTVEEVVNRMVRVDEKRLSEFQGYTAIMRYYLENKRVNKRAEMMVQLTCTSTRPRRLAVVSE